MRHAKLVATCAHCCPLCREAHGSRRRQALQRKKGPCGWIDDALRWPAASSRSETSVDAVLPRAVLMCVTTDASASLPGLSGPEPPSIFVTT